MRLFEFTPDIPAFQAWFDGSKLVHADGSPIKYYHGTSKDSDFKKFRIPGNGLWFTSDSKGASEYAMQNDSQGYEWRDGGYTSTHTASRVIPVYIKALNPLVIDTLPPEVQMAGSRGGDPTAAYRRAQREWLFKVKQQGHDAVVFGDLVIVLDSPNQVKSAIGNRAFNPKKAGMHEQIR